MKSIHAAILVVLLLAGAMLLSGCTSTQGGVTPSGTETMQGSPADSAGSLLVFSGAGLKAPMTELARAFTQRSGTGVQFSFGGSGVLISQMNLTRKGDVFVPGSTVEYGIAERQDLVGDSELIAYHVPVIAVQQGNPRKITSLRDFARPGLKIALGDLNATAIGKSGALMFGRLGIAGDVEKNVVTRTPTINELTVLMTLGQADAALLSLDQVDPAKLDAIPIPAGENEVLVVPVGVTTFAENPEGARAFAAFAASDEGKAIFERHGFPPYPNETYANITP